MIVGEYRGEPFEAEDLEQFRIMIDISLIEVIRKLGIYGASFPPNEDPDDVKEQTLKTIYGNIAAIDDLLDERFEANSPSLEES
jgi:hypothetical protein